MAEPKAIVFPTDFSELSLAALPLAKRMAAAMDAHESQLELHNYREAALGVRHFRALSLPATVAAAESFREVRALDFMTHGHVALVHALGGIPDGHQVEGGVVTGPVATDIFLGNLHLFFRNGQGQTAFLGDVQPGVDIRGFRCYQRGFCF